MSDVSKQIMHDFKRLAADKKRIDEDTEKVYKDLKRWSKDMDKFFLHITKEMKDGSDNNYSYSDGVASSSHGDNLGSISDSGTYTK